MVVSIVTGMYKRPEVFEMFARACSLLVESTEHTINLIVAGSEGKDSQELAEKHNFIYIETPNNPLADKMNKPLQIAKELNSDYVFCLGSDDIITPKLFEYYLNKAEGGYDFIGVLDFYFYHLETKKALYWAGYKGIRSGDTCGAGRMISRKILEQLDYKLWATLPNTRLDGSMQELLNNLDYSKHVFKLKDKGFIGIDLKTNDNITKFKRWPNSSYIDGKVLEKWIHLIE